MSTPVVHGFDGEQLAPGVGVVGTHDPPLQTLDAPQFVPSGLLAATMHPGEADVGQVVVPVTQEFVGWQGWPATQAATQAPALQTFPDPHDVPSALLPRSVQVAAPFGVGQLVLPILHGVDPVQN